jgi:hypothetical protein
VLEGLTFIFGFWFVGGRSLLFFLFGDMFLLLCALLP